MKATMFSLSAMMLLVVAVTVVASGCGQQASETTGGSTPTAETRHDGHEGHEHGDPRHGGWWCAEHGVPEEDCSLCSADAAAKFKEKGDWCDEHHCAESQCFKCDPSRADKFAKLYEAKFGHAPPKPEE